MILDSFSTDLTANVCNRIKKEPSEETFLQRSLSPSLISTKLSFNTSILNSPSSIESSYMMDKSSRSSSVGSDIEDTEAAVSKNESNNKSDLKSDSNQSENTTCDSNDSNLANNIRRLESIIQALKDSTTAQISQLRDMVTKKDKIILDLTEKLDQQRDYEEIKRELSMFRNEISHFGPVVSALDSSSNSHPNSNANNNNQSMLQRNSLLNAFSFPPLQSLGNVETFGTLLGEEIANSYAKAMAAAASNASNNNNNINNNNNNHNNNNNKLAGNSNANNGNNPTESSSLSPSQLSNVDEATEEKSTESTSTTPTSAMLCPDGVEPLTHSPLAAAVTDLGLNINNFNPSHNILYDKLQQYLRSNVEKYINETLNTLQISRYVRELLSIHNIGQRLFAKFVLGLSQGTVSELLSKPKPWDKLTEKGRDSYRKMHAWSSDERCINLLKMMVPRKGKDTSTYKQDNDSVTEEKIAQILNDARSMEYKTLNRPDLLAHSFLNGDKLHTKLDVKELKNNCNNNDDLSDNGSDRDENKSETSINERKSPLNTSSIGNFYKNLNLNINDSIPDGRNNGNNNNAINNNNNNNTNSNNNNNNNRSSSRSKLGDGDEMNADLFRLYQEHLTKIFGQQIEDGLRNSQNYDDIRAMMAIQQEFLHNRINPFGLHTNPELLARLISSGLFNGNNFLNGLPLGIDSLQQNNSPLDNLRKSSQSQPQQQPPSQPQDSPQLRQESRNTNENRLKMNNFLLKSEPSVSPSQNGNASNSVAAAAAAAFTNNDSADDLAASPLQRMQSITNSLLSNSSLPTLPSQPPRPAKAVLPPITQQQFDQYNNLNTEDIVKRVKEQLSQYSISQRLFGESVLGLSQGSVSDLLARPKPWHMLTQKGREPFIRMKMFLEDDNAIHKLVASQYKIAPEKLMRTGNFVSGPGIPPGIGMNASNLPSTAQLPGSPNPLSLNSLNSNSNKNSTGSNVKSGSDLAMKYEQSMSPSSVDNSARSNTSSPDLSQSNLNTSVPSPLSMRSRLSAYNNINNNILRPTLNQPSNTYLQPSVYELAALTSDLDTQIITTRIKETLMAHNIGQKIFGEVVLGLSQGSVSELLSKPKPWHMLSIKGREPFIRMQLWLNDGNNIEKLQTLKNERREANKRRRTHLDESLSSFKPFDNQLFNFSNNFGHINPLGGKGLPTAASSFSLPALNPQPVKKARILFTEEQKEALRVAFAMDPYPTSTTAEFLAKELNLSMRTITNWFHNHRMRLKQINSTASNNNEDYSNSATSYNSGRDSSLFDQNKFRTMLSQRLADRRSNNSNNENSNQFNNLFSQNSPPQMPRMKYSSSLFQSQSLYNNNSCSSPDSNGSFHEEEDMGTLDLSMPSHNQQFRTHQFNQRNHSPDKLDSTGRSSMHDDSDDGCRTGEEDEEHDVSAGDSNPMDTSLVDEQKLRKSFRNADSSRRKPQNVMSSSSRRKAAQPQQWVAPSIDLTAAAFADDDYIEEEFDDDLGSGQRSETETNGNYEQKQSALRKDNNKLINNDIDMEEDQKTDEDDDNDYDVQADDDDEDNNDDNLLTKINGSPPLFKQLKSSNKLNEDDNSSTIMQECVQ